MTDDKYSMVVINRLRNVNNRQCLPLRQVNVSEFTEGSVNNRFENRVFKKLSSSKNKSKIKSIPEEIKPGAIDETILSIESLMKDLNDIKLDKSSFKWWSQHDEISNEAETGELGNYDEVVKIKCRPTNIYPYDEEDNFSDYSLRGGFENIDYNGDDFELSSIRLEPVVRFYIPSYLKRNIKSYNVF